jgi:hypothetical protein
LSHFVALVGLDQKTFGDDLAGKDLASVDMLEFVTFCKTTLKNGTILY